MQLRKYGKLGYEVSALGMGCMRLPRIFDEQGASTVDMEKAFEMIRYAVEHGINYFDTAYSYHHRMSEAVLGEALSGGLRQKIKIATKQPFGVMRTKDDIRKNLEQTLEKLRTDYIDLYLIHNINAGSWDGIKQMDVLSEYEKFRSEGMIRGIGFSYHGNLEIFRDVLGFYEWDMCQVQQNIIDVDKEVTAEAIELAGKKGTALVIMEPLRGGGLVTPPKAVQAVYDEFSAERTGAEWAFRHLLDYPQVSTILSGMSTLEQLKQNIEIFSKPDAVAGCLSPQERDIIVRAKAAYESYISIPCTGCEYCLPCPHNVGIPSVFSNYNSGVMFGAFDQPRRSYMFMENGGSSVSKCVSCGICTTKCPQKIDVMAQLQVAHESLKGWKE